MRPYFCNALCDGFVSWNKSPPSKMKSTSFTLAWLRISSKAMKLSLPETHKTIYIFVSSCVGVSQNAERRRTSNDILFIVAKMNVGGHKYFETISLNWSAHFYFVCPSVSCDFLISFRVSSDGAMLKSCSILN